MDDESQTVGIISERDIVHPLSAMRRELSPDVDAYDADTTVDRHVGGRGDPWTDADEGILAEAA